MNKFVGEHLLAGQIGHFMVILAFTSSLLALFAYLKSIYSKEEQVQSSWIQIATYSYFVQAFAIIVVFLTLFYICSNHYYEYMYAYKHASKELEYKYLLACIWEGQEGSFLLWSIWHALLGIFIIFIHKKKKSNPFFAPLMGTLSLAQSFLMLMILGIYFFGIKIGKSPFSLTRNEIPGPIFSQPNYLDFLKDGTGMNVLLRNYWMVIHPPILFLGFASTLIPVGFLVGGFLQKKYSEWVKPALPWALFSAMVLGVGIMMGGKWAYESLNFGGYWAWDPVENASLVPWLILIGGIHTMLVFQSTGRSLRASFLFIILSFLFVLYSTFLTRTGILGDTSVHSFTEQGIAMNWMIGIFVMSFMLTLLGLFTYHYKNIPTVTSEEPTNSREFWMFIGSVVLLMSGLFIIAVTSLPVYNKTPLIKDLINKIHGGPLANPEDPEFLYNKVMIMIAIIIGVLTAITQYLNYKKTSTQSLLRKLVYPTLIAALITLLMAWLLPITYDKKGMGFLIALYLGFFASLYAVIANAWYMNTALKSKLKNSGGSITHIGFTMMIAGMIFSSGNKEVISNNRSLFSQSSGGMDPMTKKKVDPTENMTLLKDSATLMRSTSGKGISYKVTYISDSASTLEKDRKFYNILFEDISRKQKFTLHPDTYLMKDKTISSNPDIKTYLFKDVFTYLTAVSNDAQLQEEETYRFDTLGLKESRILPGGLTYSLDTFTANPHNEKYHFKPSDVALMANISIQYADSGKMYTYPALEINQAKQELNFYDDTLSTLNLIVHFQGFDESRSPNKGKAIIGFKKYIPPMKYITVKAYVFPLINLVWLGLIIMAMGICISMIKRAKMERKWSVPTLVILFVFLTYLFLFAGA